jgi:small subunit ribosomal protein S4
MARYTGPKDKISRRFGVALFGPSKALERRAFPPGQHGVRAGRRKKSDYAVALGEKQKLRFQYGVLEKQFRLYYAEATRRRGITGDLLLQILELRLDNVCYRLGLGNTRSAARQLVNHGHIQVNGKRVDIPSYQCKPGDVITVQDKPSSQQLGLRFMDLTQAVPLKEWLTLDRATMTGRIVRVPENDDMDAQVNVQLVVELYSR